MKSSESAEYSIRSTEGCLKRGGRLQLIWRCAGEMKVETHNKSLGRDGSLGQVLTL